MTENEQHRAEDKELVELIGLLMWRFLIYTERPRAVYSNGALMYAVHRTTARLVRESDKGDVRLALRQMIERIPDLGPKLDAEIDELKFEVLDYPARLIDYPVMRRAMSAVCPPPNEY